MRLGSLPKNENALAIAINPKYPKYLRGGKIHHQYQQNYIANGNETESAHTINNYLKSQESKNKRRNEKKKQKNESMLDGFSRQSSMYKRSDVTFLRKV